MMIGEKGTEVELTLLRVTAGAGKFHPPIPYENYAPPKNWTVENHCHALRFNVLLLSG